MPVYGLSNFFFLHAIVFHDDVNDNHTGGKDFINEWNREGITEGMLWCAEGNLMPKRKRGPIE